MRTSLLLLAVAVVAPLTCASPEPFPPELVAPAAVPTARFVPGDVFEVRVFGEEELSGNYQVQDDGTVNFPLVGRLEVEGLTQADAGKLLEERLGDGFLKDPNVTIVVLERQNLEVSVLGQVNAPGTFVFTEQLTLVQAISQAGGLSALAAARRVKITRRTATGPKTFEVSLQDITSGKADDLVLQPGDIVFIPESVI